MLDHLFLRLVCLWPLKPQAGERYLPVTNFRHPMALAMTTKQGEDSRKRKGLISGGLLSFTLGWKQGTGRLLTIVVSVTEPKLLMKMLQVTFTGGPRGGKTQPYRQGIPGGRE